MPQEYLGTKALVKKLTSILFTHISKSLPQIMKEIDQKVKDCEEKLRELGPSLPKDDKERMHLVWNMLTDYTENFRN
jgi:vacuolar protein sorting-associated protein 1